MRPEQKKQSFYFLTGCAIMLSVLNTFGQQPDTFPVISLDEVLVTATRSANKVSNVGRSVSVITRNEINNSAANSISELLNLHEGLYVSGAQQNPGSLSNIYTRGAGINHTVIMIDGMRITDPSSVDNAMDFSELSLTHIEQIEIVRGSHSTLYGSSAIGGVINLITVKNNTVPGFHIDAGLKGGVFNKTGSIFTEHVFLNYTHKKGLYINAEIFHNRNRGFNSTIDTVTDPSVYKHADMTDGFSKTDIIGTIGYKSGKTELYASSKKIHQISDIDDDAFHDDENYTIGRNRNMITYGASHQVNKAISLRFTGGVSNMKRIAVDDSSRIDASGTTDKSYFRSSYYSTIGNHELQVDFNFKGLKLIAGGGIFSENMSVKSYYFSNVWGNYESESNFDTLNIHATTSDGFIHADLNGSLIDELFKPFSIALGTRFTRHSAFGSSFTYEINPSVKIKESTLLYFSYTTGFNAPSLYQLYSPERDLNSGITRGNKRLNPEESRSWELGIRQITGSQFRWSVCYFNTVVENIVDYVYLWNKTNEIDSLMAADFAGDTYINLGRQTNRGIEFSIQSKITDRFLVSGNLSLVSGKLEYNAGNINPEHTQGNHIQLFSNGAFIAGDVKSLGLVRRPNTANITLTCLPSEKLSLWLMARYTGSRKDVYYDSSLGPYGALGSIGIEDFTLLDIAAKYKINRTLTARFRVENIFNTKYQEIRGYATRGRGVYGALQYSF